MLWLLILALAANCLADSDISTFTDSGCQTSYQLLKGPNGYPSGLCTALNTKGNYSSFQVVGLDSGCQATIYQADTTGDVCSGFPMLAELATCYNTSWAYYSLDNCNKPSSASSSSSSSSSSSTTLPASSTTVTATTTPEAKSSHTGAIVGGVIGGVLGPLAICAIIFFVVRSRRKRKAAQAPPQHEGGAADGKDLPPSKMLTELPNQSEVVEIDGSTTNTRLKNLEPVEMAG